MNYLFYDIECANSFGGAGKICTFGYVLTDENFKIITEDDVLINPNDKWDWYVLKNMLSYKKEDFDGKPSFPDEYRSIKNMLTNPNHITFGFDVINDLKFINDDCKRYNLPKIEIKSYDIQNFYRLYSGIKKRVGLFDIADILGIKYSSLSKHNSRDDAKVTMLVMKEISKKMESSSHELIDMCDKAFIDNSKQLKKTYSENLNSFASKFKRIYTRYPDREKYLSICFSDTIQENDADKRLELINLIFEKGYNYISKVSECNYYVSNAESGKRDIAYENNIKQGNYIKKITIRELSEMLKIKINRHGELEDDVNIEKDSFSLINSAFKTAIEKSGITQEEYMKKFS
jgi:DNA-binding protein YbaB